MNDTRAAGQEFQDQVLAAARKGQKRVASTMKTVTATAQLIRPQLNSLPTMHVAGLPTPSKLREKAPDLLAKLPTPDQLREKAPNLLTKLPTPHQLRDKAPTALKVKLPTPHELREKAPDLLAKLPHTGQLRDMAPGLFAKLPTAHELREMAPDLLARFPYADQLRPGLLARLHKVDELRDRALSGRLPSAEQVRAGAEEFAGHVISMQRQVLGHVRSATTPVAKHAADMLAQVGAPMPKSTPAVAVKDRAGSDSAEPPAGPQASVPPAEAAPDTAEHARPVPHARPRGHAKAPAEAAEHAEHAEAVTVTKPARTVPHRAATAGKKAKTRPTGK